MADKNKNASQELVAPKSNKAQNTKQESTASKPEKVQNTKQESTASKPEKVQNTKQESVVSKPEKARNVEKTQESKPVRRDNKSQSQSRQSRGTSWQARLRSNRTARFVLDAYYELRHKVTWPSARSAWNMTFVVIIFSAVIGLFLWLIDLGLYQLFLLIGNR